MKRTLACLTLALCSSAWAATAVTTNAVTLRRAASATSPRLFTVPRSTLLTVACQGEWCRTTYRGHGGYIARAYTKAVSKSVPLVAPSAPTRTSSNVYYANCTAARAAGAAPISAGQAGYRSALDRDHDGVACE